MPKEKDIDAFWDIEDMIPARPKKEMRRSAPADIDAVEISLDEKQTDDREVKIPPRAARPKEMPAVSVCKEYIPNGGFIQKVRVMPWPTLFGFYQKFRSDALRYFEREHSACDYVYFFSYMPQYDQMTVMQMSYYLYWRSEIRKGVYLKTDINYLFLYAYEIINLPDKVPPKEGAVLLSRLWGAYRNDFHYLDKYLGEWLCDYCLVHDVSPDWDVIGIFADEVTGRVSLPEFYLRERYLPFQLIAAVSAYDYRKSKYYEPYRTAFDTHIPAAMERAVNRIIMPNPEAFGIVPVKTVRDSFSGAVACHSSKFKIEVIRYAVRRSTAKNACDLKQLFSNMIKLCENQIRTVFSVKSRFSPTGIGEILRLEILAYFDEQYPDRNLKKRKKETNAEEEAYMALYEPKQSGPADISSALAIEKEAWETAALLATDEDEENSVMPLLSDSEPKREAPISDTNISFDFSEDFPSGDFDFIRGALTEEQRGALYAAKDGNFSAYCRSIGKMEENMRGEINEIAMEYIGDMLLESDFSILDDYLEDVLSVLEQGEI